MDTEQFSSEAFQRLESPVFSRALADRLRDAVLRELEPAVAEAFSKVVAALNANGHNLTPYGEQGAGEMALRDEPHPGQCRLRLACDIIISAGYADTVSVGE